MRASPSLAPHRPRRWPAPERCFVRILSLGLSWPRFSAPSPARLWKLRSHSPIPRPRPRPGRLGGAPEKVKKSDLRDRQFRPRCSRRMVWRSSIAAFLWRGALGSRCLGSRSRVSPLGGWRRFLGHRLGRAFLAALQIVDQFLSALIAIFRRFGQRLHDDFAQHGMNLAVDLDGSRGRGFDNRLPHLVRIVARESFALGRHLVQDCAQAEHVGAAVHRIAAQLFRRNVMQNVRRLARSLTGKGTHAGNSEAQDFDRAVPRDHDLGRLQTVVHDVVRVGVVQALTGLTHDVLQVPDGKSFFAGQHGGDAVALHVLLGGAALAVNFFDAEKLCDVVAAERLGAGGFLQDVLHQRVGLFGQHLQPDGLQGNRLPALRIGGLVDRANLGMRDLAEYFETSDLVGHCSLSPEKINKQAVLWKDARGRPWGKGATRISRLNPGWDA